WPRYRVLRIVDVGQYNLEISASELSDDSLYECQATEAALRSRRAKLTVLIPPDDPVIDGGPEILLTAGVLYNLTCVSRGAKPLSTIDWYKDGVLVEGAHTSTVDSPTVLLSIEPRSVLEGERVTFTCQAMANPPIMGYRWVKGGVILEGGLKVALFWRVRGRVCINSVSVWAKGGVILEGARESVFVTTADHSFFTEPVSCQVFNAVGSTNVSILVDVHFGPILVVEPRPVTVDVESDVTLNCKWAGNPPLTLTWTKKGSSMVLSNNNQLYLKSVSQADAGQYVCKAIVPRIGVGETEVTLTVNGPPIISSDPVQYAVRGERGDVRCYIASTPPPDKIVWAWKENVWEKERGTLLERYTVEQSKPLPQGGAVLSTLTINNVMESDFQSTYNCTAWNSFGPGTMIITLAETDMVPVGIIAGGTVGSSILLILFLISLAYYLHRQRKEGRRGVALKPDIKVETVNKETPSMEEDTASVSTATRMVKAMSTLWQKLEDGGNYTGLEMVGKHWFRDGGDYTGLEMFLPSVSLSPSTQPFKEEGEVKQDTRPETQETREEYELKVRLTPTHTHTNITLTFPYTPDITLTFPYTPDITLTFPYTTDITLTFPYTPDITLTFPYTPDITLTFPYTTDITLTFPYTPDITLTFPYTTDITLTFPYTPDITLTFPYTPDITLTFPYTTDITLTFPYTPDITLTFPYTPDITLTFPYTTDITLTFPYTPDITLTFPYTPDITLTFPYTTDITLTFPYTPDITLTFPYTPDITLTFPYTTDITLTFPYTPDITLTFPYTPDITLTFPYTPDITLTFPYTPDITLTFPYTTDITLTFPYTPDITLTFPYTPDITLTFPYTPDITLTFPHICPVTNINPAPIGRYEPRPSSRIAHSTYAHFNTIARTKQSQAPPKPVPQTTDYSRECGLLESTNQLAYDTYGYPSTAQYAQYRLGFAPPLEEGPAYEIAKLR
ncbi:hypothetical protein P4O66_014798, partial [Electrophorus voltai]